MRPRDFRQNESLKIIFDQDAAEDFYAKTGKQIGVTYSSHYHIMVVDLVQSPDGNRFAYERLLPAVERGAVVTVPIMEGKFILLKQFRHSLRAEQYAFPRGFAEEGMSAEENAKKEVEEELESRVLETKSLGTIVADSGVSGNPVDVVMCGIDHFSLKKDYEGIQKVIALSYEELREWVASGKINDGYTLSALTLLQMKNDSCDWMLSDCANLEGGKL